MKKNEKSDGVDAKAKKAAKERKPAEDSIFLRILWLAQTMVCLFLISIADPHSASVSLGPFNIPLLIAYFWIAIFGCYLSYHFRRQTVKWLEWLGLLVIAASCYCFLENLRAQFFVGGDIDLLIPTAHLVAGLYVSHSFELRARFDFNFSLILGLLLVFATATIGKGWIFGLGIFAYVILSALLLLLDCESRTFGAVQARKFEELDPHMSFRDSGSEKTANLVFPTAVLLAVSIGFFLVAPRAESLADTITARVYAMIRKQRDAEEGKDNTFQSLAKRVRTPYQRTVPKDRQHYEREGDKEKAERDESEKGSPGSAAKSGSNDNRSDEDGGAQPGKKGRGSGGGSASKNSKDAKGKALDAAKSKSAKSKDQKIEDGKGPKRNPIDFKAYSRTQRQKRKDEKAAATGEPVSDSSNSGDGLAGPGNSSKLSDFGPLAALNPKNSDAKNAKNKKNKDDKSIGERNNESKGPKNSKDSTNSKTTKNPKDNDPKDNAGKSADKNNSSESKNKDLHKKSRDEKEGTPASSGGEKQGPAKTSREGKQPGGSGPGKEGSGGKNAGKPQLDPNQAQGKQNGINKNAERFDIPDVMDSEAPASTRDEVIFNVTSNRTVCFRQAGFDFFDGKRWHISSDLSRGDLQRAANGAYTLNNAFPLALPDAVPSIRLIQKYHMAHNLGDKIIISGSPIEVRYPGPAIVLDTCGNLKGAWALVRGIEYNINSDEAMYDLPAMRKEAVPSEIFEEKTRKNLQAFLQIPENQSQDLFDLSDRLAGLDENWFTQAEKICKYMRKTYKYTLDPKAKGNSKNSVDRFLFETQTGDCKDFASAFVLLCRASGIPARMTMGYGPGDFDALSGTRQVKVKDAHAWGEVYIPSSGWVPFDATPNGTMPAREKEQERYFTTLKKDVQNSLQKVQLGQAPGADAQGQGQVQVVDGGQTGPNGSSNAAQGAPGEKSEKKPGFTLNLWDLVKYIPIAIAMAIFVGPLVLFLKDIAKNIKLPRRVHPATKVLSRLQKDLKSFDVSTTDSSTAGEFLDKLRDKLSESESINVDPAFDESLEDFVQSYNSVFFGERGSLKELEQKRQRIKKLLKK